MNLHVDFQMLQDRCKVNKDQINVISEAKEEHALLKVLEYRVMVWWILEDLEYIINDYYNSMPVFTQEYYSKVFLQ